MFTQSWRPIVFLLAVALTLAAMPANVASAANTTYYVATSGSDAHPGTLAAPFKTIQKAAALAQPGDTVLLRGGVYRETVTPANSGMPDAPISFRSYPSERATVSGADVVSGPWSASGANYVAAGVAGFSSSLHQAEQVFVDGRMINLARWPNTTLDISRPARATIASILANDNGAPTRTISFADAALTQPPSYWVGATIWVAPDLAYQKITGIVINSAPGQLTFTYNANTADSGSQGSPVAGSGYVLFGIPAALDAPAEWYPSPANTLTLRTPNGDNPANHVVELKRRDYAFNLDSRSFITIANIDMFAATITTDLEAGGGDGSVRQDSIAPASNIIIDGIRAKYLSHFTDQTEFVYTQWSNNTGIVLSGSNHTLQNSVLEWSAGNGVSLLGQNSKVLNNVIHDVAYTGCECAAINTGFNNTLSFDHEIGQNTAYTSGKNIVLFRNLANSDAATPRARIHHNDFSNAALLTADTGILYTWSASEPGRDLKGLEIDHNVLHNNYNKSAAPAIYLDGTIQNLRVHHNVTWNAGGIVTGGQNNLIFNNTFTGISGAPGSNNPNNQGTILRNNIYTARTTFASPTWTNTDNLEYTVDPQFCDPARANFVPQAGSPAIDTGVLLPPFTNGFLGAAPDRGAYETNPAAPCQPNWTAGANLRLPTPSAPTNLRGTFNTAQVDLTWQNTAPSSSIVVERSDNGESWHTVATLLPGATSYSDVGLYPANYLYRVRADSSPYSVVAFIDGGRSALGRTQATTYDAFGGGDNQINPFGPVGGYDHGNWLKYVGVALPSGLTSFTANIQTWTGTQATVEVWVDALPTYADGPGGGFKIANLNLIGKPQNDFGAYEDFTTTVISGYPTGKHDVYVLAAPAEDGRGDIGNLQSFQFLSDQPAMAAGTALAALPLANKRVALYWSDTNADKTGTIIERSTDQMVYYEIGRVLANTTVFTDTGLTLGVKYFYRVHAYRAGAISPLSASAAVTAAQTPTPTLVAAPAELSFSAYSGGANPPAQTITLRSSPQDVRVRVASGSPVWLSVSPASGTVPSGMPLLLTVQATPGTLAVGTYTANVVVESLNKKVSGVTVPVSFIVLPALNVNPTQLSFSAYSGLDAPTPASITLSSADGAVPWAATGGTSWLSINPPSGMVSPDAPATLDLVPNISGLAPGTYTAQVALVDTRIPSDRATVDVTLIVRPLRDAYSTIQAASLDADNDVNPFCCGVGGLDKEDWMRYDGVNFGAAPGAASISVEIGVPDDNAGGQIEFRLDSVGGPLIGTLNLTGTGGYGGGNSLVAAINGATGIHDLYLVVKQGTSPNGYGLANFYNFTFAKAQ